MDRFVPRDDAQPVIASEAWQSIPAHHHGSLRTSR
jgi:hypothetical protein